MIGMSIGRLCLDIAGAAAIIAAVLWLVLNEGRLIDFEDDLIHAIRMRIRRRIKRFKRARRARRNARAIRKGIEGIEQAAQAFGEITFEVLNVSAAAMAAKIATVDFGSAIDLFADQSKGGGQDGDRRRWK